MADLDRIRVASEEIAQKLIIEEPEDTAPAEDIAEMTARIEDDVFEERTELAAKEVHSLYDFSSLDEDWRRLAESLDAEQLELVKALDSGVAEDLCRDRGMLPETAFELLNAAALEHIGDCLVENGELIPDYAEDLKAIVSLIK